MKPATPKLDSIIKIADEIKMLQNLVTKHRSNLINARYWAVLSYFAIIEKSTVDEIKNKLKNEYVLSTMTYLIEHENFFLINFSNKMEIFYDTTDGYAPYNNLSQFIEKLKECKNFLKTEKNERNRSTNDYS